MYDVANIFSALGIIEKKKLLGARKPGFCWNKDSRLISGRDEFPRYDDLFDEEEDLVSSNSNVSASARDEEDYEEEEEDEEELKPSRAISLSEICDINPPRMVQRRSSLRVGKRKLFDSEDTAASSADLQLADDSFSLSNSQSNSNNNTVSFSSLSDAADCGVAAVAKVEPNVPEKKVKVATPKFVSGGGRPLNFPSVRNNASAPTRPSMASPETEKTVASLLMSFGSGTSLFN